ncbi:MAG: 23S rRNA (adenine(2503)-C(2))-methyltransferase RlmN [Actinobacteria bacterium]|nr:MAG: 23S rRNA (adenine(2503)-C(2))-methyltransferase RlmN [Actinomycetota bacterium]
MPRRRARGTWQDASAATIASMDLELLEQTLARHGQPRFRARQVWGWAARGAASYEQMTDLPAWLREALASELPFSSLQLQRESRACDGTIKARFATRDGHPLETVLMRYRDRRRSICVSSQSGCPLDCTFCATGRMRFARNLSASEIVDQALHFTRVEEHPRYRSAARGDHGAHGGHPATPRASGQGERAARPLTHCVFMGMGEPMLNLDAVLAACERLPDLGVTQRRTTISTVGWIPGIERLAEHDRPLRLAISVHAAEEALRSQLMPVNDRFPLRDVIDAARAFHARRRRRIFVEYVLLAGVNDRYEQALALARLLTGPAAGAYPAARARPAGGPGERSAAGPRPGARGSSIFKVNLIPYNATIAAGADPYRGSTRESIAAFQAALQSRGIPATVRLTRGRAINAACGQLAAEVA